MHATRGALHCLSSSACVRHHPWARKRRRSTSTSTKSTSLSTLGKKRSIRRAAVGLGTTTTTVTARSDDDPKAARAAGARAAAAALASRPQRRHLCPRPPLRHQAAFYPRHRRERCSARVGRLWRHPWQTRRRSAKSGTIARHASCPRQRTWLWPIIALSSRPPRRPPLLATPTRMAELCAENR